jgi:hypothetical protein
LRRHLEEKLERLHAMRWQEMSYRQWQLRRELASALKTGQGRSAG